MKWGQPPRRKLLGCGVLLAAALLAAFLTHGCSATYVVHQAWHQAGLLWYARPIEVVLADPATPDPVKEGLRKVVDVKVWGETSLGLTPTKNYRKYAQVEGGAASWVVCACPPDSLEPYTWWFPAVGHVPYKGYFHKSQAEAARDHLQKKGYDTCLRAATAYSTLGWFSDPVLSNFVDLPEFDLADLVLHELAHSTVYLSSHADFNETWATLVGQQGALAWMSHAYGPESAELKRSQAELRDEERDQAFWRDLAARLRALYDRKLPKEAALAEKQRIFKETPAAFAAIPWETDAYPAPDPSKLNNAVIAAQLAYVDELPLLKRLLDKLGSLQAFLDFGRKLDGKEDPWAVVKKEINHENTKARK